MNEKINGGEHARKGDDAEFCIVRIVTGGWKDPHTAPPNPRISFQKHRSEAQLIIECNHPPWLPEAVQANSLVPCRFTVTNTPSKGHQPLVIKMGLGK